MCVIAVPCSGTVPKKSQELLSPTLFAMPSVQADNPLTAF